MKSVPKTVLCPDPIGQAQVGSNELPASMQHPSLFEPNKNINKPSVSRVLKIGQLVLGKSGNQSDSTGIQIVAKTAASLQWDVQFRHNNAPVFN